jgi:REP element-mobilizing transposase RayT
MSKLPQRKPNRLQGYDYAQNGAYFVTICAKGRAELFGKIVGANVVRPPQNDVRPPHIELSDVGQTVDNEIKTMQTIRKNIVVHHYVVMPNHVHMIIAINSPDNGGRTTFAPTISRIIKHWKEAISKQIGFSAWQKSFHDHIIRDDNDYNRIAEYIENNPTNWENDCFYGEAAFYHPQNGGKQ